MNARTDKIIGPLAERRAFGEQHREAIAAVLGASQEFRHAVVPPYGPMTRGEAQHILRAVLEHQRKAEIASARRDSYAGVAGDGGFPGCVA